MHRVAQQQSLLHAALADGLLALRGDVDEAHARGDVEREVVGVALHRRIMAAVATPT